MPEASILSFNGRNPEHGEQPQVPAAPLPEATTRLSRRSGKSLFAIAAMFVIFGPVATLVPISGAVIASGAIGAESRFTSIVHPSGGVLSELLVREGQAVQAGQVLMKFATSVTEPGARYAGESLTSLMVRKARLEAEVTGAASFQVPADLVGPDSSEATQAIAREHVDFR